MRRMNFSMAGWLAAIAAFTLVSCKITQPRGDSDLQTLDALAGIEIEAPTCQGSYTVHESLKVAGSDQPIRWEESSDRSEVPEPLLGSLSAISGVEQKFFVDIGANISLHSTQESVEKSCGGAGVDTCYQIGDRGQPIFHLLASDVVLRSRMVYLWNLYIASEENNFAELQDQKLQLVSAFLQDLISELGNPERTFGVYISSGQLPMWILGALRGLHTKKAFQDVKKSYYGSLDAKQLLNNLGVPVTDIAVARNMIVADFLKLVGFANRIQAEYADSLQCSQATKSRILDEGIFAKTHEFMQLNAISAEEAVVADYQEKGIAIESEVAKSSEDESGFGLNNGGYGRWTPVRNVIGRAANLVGNVVDRRDAGLGPANVKRWWRGGPLLVNDGGNYSQPGFNSSYVTNGYTNRPLQGMRTSQPMVYNAPSTCSGGSCNSAYYPSTRGVSSQPAAASSCASGRCNLSYSMANNGAGTVHYSNGQSTTFPTSFASTGAGTVSTASGAWQLVKNQNNVTDHWYNNTGYIYGSSNLRPRFDVNRVHTGFCEDRTNRPFEQVACGVNRSDRRAAIQAKSLWRDQNARQIGFTSDNGQIKWVGVQGIAFAFRASSMEFLDLCAIPEDNYANGYGCGRLAGSQTQGGESAGAGKGNSGATSRALEATSKMLDRSIEPTSPRDSVQPDLAAENERLKKELAELQKKLDALIARLPQE